VSPLRVSTRIAGKFALTAEDGSELVEGPEEIPLNVGVERAKGRDVETGRALTAISPLQTGSRQRMRRASFPASRGRLMSRCSPAAILPRLLLHWWAQPRSANTAGHQRVKKAQGCTLALCHLFNHTPIFSGWINPVYSPSGRSSKNLLFPPRLCRIAIRGERQPDSKDLGCGSFTLWKSTFI